MSKATATGSTALLGLLAVLVSPGAFAAIEGITGPAFNLTVKQDFINTADGNNVTVWGYSDDSCAGGLLPECNRAQYPGPTLIVNQGDTVTVNLKNGLNAVLNQSVSMVFPGQASVAATCSNGGTDGSCVDGLLTTEAGSDGDQVTYTFTAGEPGTYLYHSGTRPDLQVEMGLFGALIVRPSQSANQAYNHADTAFHREHLFVLSEMDVNIHIAVALAQTETQIDNIDPNDPLDDGGGYFPVYWLINGRTAPDTVSDPYVAWLPVQPYNALTRAHPGEKVLMRVVGMSRDSHPFHHHGNHALIVARDGRMLESAPGAGPDLSRADFTIQTQPGTTYDALFEWTGKGMGWDVYGTVQDGLPDHVCIDADGDGFGDAEAGSTYDHEFCADHGKPFPVTLPELSDLAFGAWWSGSPFLGQLSDLPPGEGGLNPTGGYFFMWHSHSEKELTNFDIFPGGMFTMMVVEHPDLPIQ